MTKKTYTLKQIDNVRTCIKVTSAATIALSAYMWIAGRGAISDLAFCSSLLFYGVLTYDGACNPANNLANWVLDWVEPETRSELSGDDHKSEHQN